MTESDSETIIKAKQLKLNYGNLYAYLCIMENEINLQVKKDANFVAANKRSDKYALKRNLQALEFNEAIITRQLAESKNNVKCEKCGKEFAAGTSPKDSLICPKCK